MLICFLNYLTQEMNLQFTDFSEFSAFFIDSIEMEFHYRFSFQILSLADFT